MDVPGFFIVAAAGYLLGSVPFAVIIARLCGVDILKAGSGNPGATNVKRVCGRVPGNICFVLDAAKGFLATAWPLYPSVFGVQFSDPQTLGYVGLCSAIVGHSFSVFLKFRGGKGVATAIGGLLAVMFWAILAGLAVWVAVFYASRYVSLASLALAAALPAASYAIYPSMAGHFYISLAIAAVIIFRHRANIARLIKGTENRF